MKKYVADDIIYPFNEYVKLGVESGIMGLGILVAVLLFVFSPSKNEKMGINFLAFKAGILGLIIFAFFSYPAEILPVILNLTILLALLSRQKGIILQKRIFPEPTRLRRHAILSWPFSIPLIIIVIGMYLTSKRLYQAYFFWDEGYKIYQMNAYDECLKSFEESYDELKNNGEFLIMYGKALSMAGKDESAIHILVKAKQYQQNSILFNALGDSYKNLKQYRNAEESYLQAYFMIPSRFYSKYLLVKMYAETGQIQKAKKHAREILEKEVKVPSRAIEEIQAETRAVLK